MPVKAHFVLSPADGGGGGDSGAGSASKLMRSLRASHLRGSLRQHLATDDSGFRGRHSRPPTGAAGSARNNRRSGVRKSASFAEDRGAAEVLRPTVG